MKKKMSDLGERERIKTLDMLYTAASAVKGRDAVKRFLRDLLTPSERIMLGRRVWIARLLLSGMNEAEVGRRLGVGPNTVYRVAGWLGDQFPGYEDAIAGLEKEMGKRKYPLHFLLFPNPKPKNRYRD